MSERLYRDSDPDAIIQAPPQALIANSRHSERVDRPRHYPRTPAGPRSPQGHTVICATDEQLLASLPFADESSTTPSKFSDDPHVQQKHETVDALVDGITTATLALSHTHRKDDEELLKLWKGELFAVIEPAGRQEWYYKESDQEDYSDYNKILVWLKTKLKNTREMIVPVKNWLGRDTGKREIGLGFTVDRLIECWDLGYMAEKRLKAYREEHEHRIQHSLRLSEAHRISHRMAAISHVDTSGPASQKNGGLLF